ncbi:MAG: AbgT family transporter [Emcibacter sp.]|nr:AbgT family transporter [Emcibacter sp.]
MTNETNVARQTGILGWVERTGNRLPDPVFIFFYLILFLAITSAVLAAIGLNAIHPTATGTDGSAVIVEATSLFSADNIQRLLVEMPKTMTHFHPLGYVLVVMLGAGVAERSGLFGTAMRAGVRKAPTFLLTPAVALVAMLGNLAADAAYVVLIPLAGILYASANRNPIAGIAAAFAGVSGGFSANLLPGQLDALLFGITETAAETLDPMWDANIAGNWYFIAFMTVIYLPTIWYVTDKIIEPRLGKWNPAKSNMEINIDEGNKEITDDESKGLRWAGYATIGVIALWVFLTLGPGTPLINEAAKPEAQLTPFYRSLVAGFLVLFLATACAYGSATGTIKNHRDVVSMMSNSMGDMAYYLVLTFGAAHFVAMFNWSNLGLIFAIQGADAIETSGMPMPVIIVMMILLTGLINLFVGSASAKWALLAPVLVPMLMLLGISPEMTTAAYRVGDSATNIITPLMVYFPLILLFCKRWNNEFGLGSLTAVMIPYSVGLLVMGIIMTAVWVSFDLPLGPMATMSYILPGGS